MRSLIILPMFAALAGFGCAKSEDYDPISTTRVRPPVQESLPDTLLANGSFGLATAETDYSKTCQTDAAAGDACQDYEDAKRIRCIVKNRLFCSGPTEVLTLLDGVDGRLAEIEARSDDGEVTCIDAAPVDLTSQITYPADASLAGKFQCQDSSIGLGFGREGTNWYVREANGASAQAFAIDDSGVVEGYIWLPSSDGSMSQSTGLLHLVADKEAKEVEITGGGVGFGFCGLHMKSNGSNIYLIMNADGAGVTCDYDGSGTTDASDWVEACLDVETLDEADADACEGLRTLSLATLGRDESEASSGKVYEAAPDNAESISRFELVDYLQDAFDLAGTFTGVAEFTVQKE